MKKARLFIALVLPTLWIMAVSPAMAQSDGGDSGANSEGSGEIFPPVQQTPAADPVVPDPTPALDAGNYITDQYDYVGQDAASVDRDGAANPSTGGATRIPTPFRPANYVPSNTTCSAGGDFNAFRDRLVSRNGYKTVVYSDGGNPPRLLVGVGHVVQPEDNLQLGDKVTTAQIVAFLERDARAAWAAAQAQATAANIAGNCFLLALGAVNYELGTEWRTKYPDIWDMIMRRDYAGAANALNNTQWKVESPIRVKDFQDALRDLAGAQTAAANQAANQAAQQAAEDRQKVEVIPPTPVAPYIPFPQYTGGYCTSGTTPPVSASDSLFDCGQGDMSGKPESGPIVARSGQVIENLHISNPNGACIVEPGGVTNVTIRNNEIGPCGASKMTVNNEGVRIEAGASNITIEKNIIHDVSAGLFAAGARHPIIFHGNYIYNIRGPIWQGNILQFNNVRGGSGSSKITCNINEGDGTPAPVAGRVYSSDHISMYNSLGNSNAEPIEIAYNRIQGPSSNGEESGSGMQLGDSPAGGGGSGSAESGYYYVHDNTIARTNGGGISVAGGHDIRIENNRVENRGDNLASATGWPFVIKKFDPNSQCYNISYKNNRATGRLWAFNHDGSEAASLLNMGGCTYTETGNNFNDRTLTPAIFNEAYPQCAGQCVRKSKSGGTTQQTGGAAQFFNQPTITANNCYGASYAQCVTICKATNGASLGPAPTTATGGGGTTGPMTDAAVPEVPSCGTPNKTPSGPIVARSGQVIENLHVTSQVGACVVVPAGVTNVIIRNNELGPCGTSQNTIHNEGVRVEGGSNNVTIQRNVIHDVSAALLAADASHPIIFDRNYIYNIRGPVWQGNIVQFARVRTGVGQSKITCNVKDGRVGIPYAINENNNWHIGDHISMYETLGTQQNPVEIAYNRVRGDFSRGYEGGSGMQLSDGTNGTAGLDGGWYNVHHNTVVQTNGGGIAVAGGHNISVHDNRVYNRADSPLNETGWSFAIRNFNPGAQCYGHEFVNNRSAIATLWAFNNDGSPGMGLIAGGEGAGVPKCTFTQSGNNFNDTSLNAGIFFEKYNACDSQCPQLGP